MDRSVAPTSAPPRPLVLPRFERFALDNGLEVRVAERRHLPEVSLRLVVEGGAGINAPDRAGVASLTGQLLTEGTVGRDAPRMAEWLDRLGASFTVTTGYDVTVLSMQALSDVVEGALDYLAASVLTPAFAEGDVERVRHERLAEIDRKRDDAANLAAEAFVRAVYADHPYGRLARGTPESVGALGPPAVRGFHAERYAPAGATLIACGDVGSEAFAGWVADRFGDWEGEGIPSIPPAVPPLAAQAGAVVMVDRPGSGQSEIRVGRIGLRRGAEDEFDARVMNAVLGGVFSSRINMNLREDKGWTYGARSSLWMRREAGPFMARAAVHTAVTADAIAEILAEFERLVTSPPSDAELLLARNALTLSLPRQFETPGQIAVKVVDQATFGLPDDYWITYRERIAAVAREGVVRAAERYLDAESLVIVVVGDAREVGTSLERFGPVRPLKVVT